jgi:hypothetical protein
VALAGALVVGACNGGDDSSSSFGGYSSYGGDGCQQFTSCTACTPVPGCGWCFDSDGRGMCAASPDECATPAFSWTWNPSGCRIPADASTAQAPDAGPPPPPEEDVAVPPGEADAAPPTGKADAAPPAADGAVATDGPSARPEASAPDGAVP